MKNYLIIIGLFVALSAQNTFKSHDAAIGVGVGYHTTEITNFEDAYDTDSWVMYNIDVSLKLYELGEEFTLFGQLSFTGGPVEYTETINGNDFTREFSQAFIHYGVRVAYLIDDFSMSWVGFGIASPNGKATSKSSGNSSSTTYEGEDGNYLELGMSVPVDDEILLYLIWRGTDGELFKDGNSFGSPSVPKFKAGGQHFLIGVQWYGMFNF